MQVLHNMFEYFKFPAGEVHCRLQDWVFESETLYKEFDGKESLNDYIMSLLMVADVHKFKRLFLPYLPYSRQDRPTSKNEPFSLKVLGKVLATANFPEIVTMDVHSDAAFGCVDNLRNIAIEDILDLCEYGNSYGKTLVIPDQGAWKRLKNVSDSFGNSVICVKERNTETGYLTIKQVVGDYYKRKCLIVDDICDGGATFIQLATELLNNGAEEVNLFVTHGIFSKGIQVLRDAGINQIFTTDSFPKKDGVDYVVSCEEIYKKGFLGK